MHSKINSTVTNSYRLACSSSSGSLEQFLSRNPELKEKMKELCLELEYQKTCRKILDDGDISNLIETWH